MIHVENVSKKFKLYKSPADRLKEIIFRRSFHKDFQSLKDVSLHVNDGETMGIIGANGAGKSTLLKVLSGIIIPDSGTVNISGKVTGLLELGTGFNGEMTGRQNIYMNGLLIGMTKEEIDKRLETIIEFTELGSFIDNSIKTYSSGMVMRLAFSIAYHAEPSCFLVDEALSVGDAHFQQKCVKAIRGFKERGGSIIFVSHDMNAVKMLCDKAILLSHGMAIDKGNPEKVVNTYNSLLTKLDENDTSIKMTKHKSEKTDYGTMEIKITRVTITGINSDSSTVSSGERTTISVIFISHIDKDNITIGIAIRDKYGQDIFGTNTYHNNVKIECKNGCEYICEFIMDMNIGPGKYTVTTAVHTDDNHIESCYNWMDRAVDFEVVGISGHFFNGITRLKPEIRIRSEQNK
ncbi:MAG: ABC transporter ATP-binding protein [Synergistaceae bacterium]|nr:ABC transporter ATP-binding protein [Synergistaceae bacterium]